MKLRAGLILACLTLFVSAQASATIRSYTFLSNQTIFTITEPFGVLVPKGTWEGTYTRTVLDDCDGCLTPTLIRNFVQSTFTRTFDTTSTTGSPGTYGFVEVDTRSVSGGNIVGSRTFNYPAPGNVSFNFGAIPAKATGGRGQRCTDGPPGAATGGCAVAGLAPVWAQAIVPVNPVTRGPMVFQTSALDTYTLPSAYLYFDLRPTLGVPIYGFYTAGEGQEIPPVPVFAPLGAVALGGGLIIVGARSLRRRS